MMAYVLIVSWVLAPAFLWNAIYVVTGSYTAAGPWFLVDWLKWSNPYLLAFAPYNMPGRTGMWSDLGFLAGALGISGLLLALATLRVRRVARKRAGRPAAGRWQWSRPWLPGPSIDASPVAWREWHRVRPSLLMRIVWGHYAAIGLVCMALSARAVWGDVPGAADAVGIMDAVQVSIGLLLLGVAATTGLAEERARGSLEVLLSTPMSTRAILNGKWRGGYRRALGVAIWPALIAASLALHGGYWSGYVLLLGLVLAHAAVVNSLGLVVATWVRRPGHAVAACMTIMALTWIGWPLFLILTILRGEPASSLGLVAGNPQIGVNLATIAVSQSPWVAEDLHRTDVFAWTIGWIMVLALIAWTLFSAAQATFDECLGRIPDAGLPRPLPPRRKSSLSTGELLAMVPEPAEGEEE
jgi:ABC-type transport system involved in multi-copper enzyme maturation permease subunit